MLKHNIQTIREVMDEDADSTIYEFQWFVNELRDFNFVTWYREHKMQILARFKLQPTEGLQPHEVLQFFVEHEILGETEQP